jgi:DNA modification methylase
MVVSPGDQPPLAIVYRRVDQLKPNPTNPRQHNRRQTRRLAKLIKTFRFRNPIQIDASGTIIAGHARWEAARLVGLTEVPTILVDDLSEAELKAFMIADNRIAELATWNDKALSELLLDLSQIESDLDLELTGFDMGEIDFRIEGLGAISSDKPDPADLIPAKTESPVNKLGDIWDLGGNKLLCGSALDASSYIALLGGKHAAGAFFDPAYNVPIHGHASGLGKIRHREFEMASGEMSEAEYTKFLHESLSHLLRNIMDGGVIFECIDWRHLWEALSAARSSGCSLLNLCVWTKHNAGMGSFYRSQHELVLVLKRKHTRHVNNVMLGRYGRNRTNVWAYRGANDFGRGDGESDLLKLHPTVKPVAMVADALMDTTRRGDIVLDSFLGSGTTLIAAERTDRKCYGIEIDPLYVDLAIRRWQAWTRNVARHAETGLTFDETAERMGAPHG